MSNKKAATDRQFATIADYQKTFGGPTGKKVLRHLMRNCGMMMPSMTMNRPDALALAFNEGKRSVVIEILEKVRFDLAKVEKEITQHMEEDDVQI